MKEGHKHSCEKPDVPRHMVDTPSIEAIQTAIDAADPGDIIILPEGSYHWESNAPRMYHADLADLAKSAQGESNRDVPKQLKISKPIKIWGPSDGRNKVSLN